MIANESQGSMSAYDEQTSLSAAGGSTITASNSTGRLSSESNATHLGA